MIGTSHVTTASTAAGRILQEGSEWYKSTVVIFIINALNVILKRQRHCVESITVFFFQSSNNKANFTSNLKA